MNIVQINFFFIIFFLVMTLINSIIGFINLKKIKNLENKDIKSSNYGMIANGIIHFIIFLLSLAAFIKYLKNLIDNDVIQSLNEIRSIGFGISVILFLVTNIILPSIAISQIKKEDKYIKSVKISNIVLITLSSLMYLIMFLVLFFIKITY